jgi:uncharacterized protein YjlB
MTHGDLLLVGAGLTLVGWLEDKADMMHVGAYIGGVAIGFMVARLAIFVFKAWRATA